MTPRTPQVVPGAASRLGTGSGVGASAARGIGASPKAPSSSQSAAAASPSTSSMVTSTLGQFLEDAAYVMQQAQDTVDETFREIQDTYEASASALAGQSSTEHFLAAIGAAPRPPPIRTIDTTTRHHRTVTARTPRPPSSSAKKKRPSNSCSPTATNDDDRKTTTTSYVTSLGRHNEVEDALRTKTMMMVSSSYKMVEEQQQNNKHQQERLDDDNDGGGSYHRGQNYEGTHSSKQEHQQQLPQRRRLWGQQDQSTGGGGVGIENVSTISYTSTTADDTGTSTATTTTDDRYHGTTTYEESFDTSVNTTTSEYSSSELSRLLGPRNNEKKKNVKKQQGRTAARSVKDVRTAPSLQTIRSGIESSSWPLASPQPPTGRGIPSVAVAVREGSPGPVKGAADTGVSAHRPSLKSRLDDKLSSSSNRSSSFPRPDDEISTAAVSNYKNYNSSSIRILNNKSVDELGHEKRVRYVTRTKTRLLQDVGLDFIAIPTTMNSNNNNQNISLSLPPSSILLVRSIQSGSLFEDSDLEVGDALVSIDGIMIYDRQQETSGISGGGARVFKLWSTTSMTNSRADPDLAKESLQQPGVTTVTIEYRKFVGGGNGGVSDGASVIESIVSSNEAMTALSPSRSRSMSPQPRSTLIYDPETGHLDDQENSLSDLPSTHDVDEKASKHTHQRSMFCGLQPSTCEPTEAIMGTSAMLFDDGRDEQSYDDVEEVIEVQLDSTTAGDDKRGRGLWARAFGRERGRRNRSLSKARGFLRRPTRSPEPANRASKSKSPSKSRSSNPASATSPTNSRLDDLRARTQQLRVRGQQRLETSRSTNRSSPGKSSSPMVANRFTTNQDGSPDTLVAQLKNDAWKIYYGQGTTTESDDDKSTDKVSSYDKTRQLKAKLQDLQQKHGSPERDHDSNSELKTTSHRDLHDSSMLRSNNNPVSEARPSVELDDSSTETAVTKELMALDDLHAQIQRGVTSTDTGSIQHQDELARLNRKVADKLRGNIEQLKRSNMKLSEEISTLRRDEREKAELLKILESNIKECQERERKLNYELELSRSRFGISMLQHDKREKEWDEEMNRMKLNHQNTLDESSEQIETLEKANRVLTTKLQAADRDREFITNVKDELSKARKMLAEQSDTLEHLRSENKAAVTRRQEVEEELERCRLDLEAASHNPFETELAVHQARIAFLENQVEELKAELKEKMQSLRQERGQRAILQKEAEEARRQFETLAFENLQMKSGIVPRKIFFDDDDDESSRSKQPSDCERKTINSSVSRKERNQGGLDTSRLSLETVSIEELVERMLELENVLKKMNLSDEQRAEFILRIKEGRAGQVLIDQKVANKHELGQEQPVNDIPFVLSASPNTSCCDQEPVENRPRNCTSKLFQCHDDDTVPSDEGQSPHNSRYENSLGYISSDNDESFHELSSYQPKITVTSTLDAVSELQNHSTLL